MHETHRTQLACHSDIFVVFTIGEYLTLVSERRHLAASFGRQEFGGWNTKQFSCFGFHAGSFYHGSFQVPALNVFQIGKRFLASRTLAQIALQIKKLICLCNAVPDFENHV